MPFFFAGLRAAGVNPSAVEYGSRMNAKTLALLTAVVAAALPAGALAQAESTVTSAAKPTISSKPWTVTYESAIRNTTGVSMRVLTQATCVYRRKPNVNPPWWIGRQAGVDVFMGGTPAGSAVLCDGTEEDKAWPDEAIIAVKKFIVIPMQISPSLRLDLDECEGYCAVVRRNGTRRIPIRVQGTGLQTQTYRLTLTVSDYRPERLRKVWEGTDEFVNFCINQTIEIRSSGGRLYCDYAYPASAKVRAKVGS